MKIRNKKLRIIVDYIEFPLIILLMRVIAKHGDIKDIVTILNEMNTGWRENTRLFIFYKKYANRLYKKIS